MRKHCDIQMKQSFNEPKWDTATWSTLHAEVHRNSIEEREVDRRER